MTHPQESKMQKMRKRFASVLLLTYPHLLNFCAYLNGEWWTKIRYANLGHDDSWARSGNYYMQKG